MNRRDSADRESRATDRSLSAPHVTREMRSAFGDLLMTTVVLVALAISTLVFLRGFLPLKTLPPGRASIDDFLSEPNGTRVAQAPKYSRLVIMLVDALRRDFVFGGDDGSGSSAMPFVQQLIAHRQVLQIGAAAHPPTVTMPRVKALTTGDIPGFMDLVLNLNTKALTSDNLISQLKSAGKRIVFYGDETWLALFPGHFERYEGTTSFFVSDYTEVDLNVTRNVALELARADWDVMILHYLGLDHIGHLEGPKSKLVQPKLAEMDAVLQQIYTAVIQQDDARGSETALMLCGDHGMSDAGSHGGASTAEIQTPFLLASRDFEGMQHHVLERYQIDIVPTLAALLGMPEPRSSLGVIVPEALVGLPLRERLSAVYRNLQQLQAALAVGLPKSGGALQAEVEQAERAHLAWLAGSSPRGGEPLAERALSKYLAVATKLQSLGASALIRYDVSAMLYSVVMFFLALLLALGQQVAASVESSGGGIGVGAATSVACCALTVTAVQLTCTSSEWHSGLICDNGTTWRLCYALLFGVLAAAAVESATRFPIRRMLPGIGRHLQVPSFSLQSGGCAMLGALLGAGTVVRSLTFLSSSFVEEEQQTWYYLSSTALLFMLLVRRTGASSSAVSVHLYDSRQAQCSDAPACAAPLDDSRLPSAAWRLALALVLARLMRAWNRTGNKWAHLPDIGDWLRGNENDGTAAAALLPLAVGGSLVGAGWWAASESRLADCAPFLLGLPTALLMAVADSRQQAATADTAAAVLTSDQRVAVACTGFTLVLTCVLWPMLPWAVSKFNDCLRRQPAVSGRALSKTVPPRTDEPCCTAVDVRRFVVCLRQAWLLLVLVLHKPHNVPLSLAMVLQERLLADWLVRRHRTAASSVQSGAVVGWTLLYAWLGQAGYFAQGNSNSISTIDVGAGYKGSVDYNPLVVGTLMMCLTFASQVFWLLSLVLLLLRVFADASDGCSRDPAARSLARFCSSLRIVSGVCVIERCFTMCIYSALIVHARYHLFVWSVFAPKLLYESVFTVLGVMLSMTLSVCCAFVLPRLEKHVNEL